MRDSSNCWVAKRRLPRTRPLMIAPGAPNGTASSVSTSLVMRSILANDSSSCGTVPIWPRRASTTPASTLATVGALVSRSAAPGPAPLPMVQNGGNSRLASGVVAITRCSSFTPDTPSIRLWCILM
jgi:hypothetical protein